MHTILYQTDKERIELFHKIIDTYTNHHYDNSGMEGIIETLNPREFLTSNVAAMSADLGDLIGRPPSYMNDYQGGRIIDEINFYSSMKSFKKYMELTDEKNSSWEFEYYHPVANLVVPYLEVDERINMKDLFVTCEMDGWDELIGKLVSLCKVCSL